MKNGVKKNWGKRKLQRIDKTKNRIRQSVGQLIKRFIILSASVQ